MNKITDYAIDIETLSTSRKNLPALVEIGAVKFDRESGVIIDEFHRYIELESALEYGTVDADTLNFWFAQSNAKMVMSEGPRTSIFDAFFGLESFLYCPDGRGRYWAWGAEFDLRVLIGTDEAISGPPGGEGQIPYRSVRDARTYCTELAEQFGIILPTQDARTKHNALDDAKHCARLVSGVYSQMMVAVERLG